MAKTKCTPQAQYITIPRNKIKAAAAERGIKFKDIAVELGVNRGTVAGVIAGKNKSKRIMDYILIRLGFME